MSDLLDVLPNFDSGPFRHLTHSLEKNEITVSELVTFDPIDVAKRCPLPLNDLKTFIATIVRALHDDSTVQLDAIFDGGGDASLLGTTGLVGNQDTRSGSMPWTLGTIKVMDQAIDARLNGGFRTGYISEIVGESAAGKTQFVLGLLLSVQLPPPNGLGKSAIYLSTEASLNTGRLHQMIADHPFYQALPETEIPSLDKIHAITAGDLETQEHIIQYQLSRAVRRFEVGLVVMDSVAANLRAEHETHTARGRSDRAQDLMKLGRILRRIAVEHNVAVVVTNQVSDRFEEVRPSQDRQLLSSPMPFSSPLASRQAIAELETPVHNARMMLDHQQRFFTGWGDATSSSFEQLKNPALGIAWVNQLSTRIVLKIEGNSSGTTNTTEKGIESNIWNDKKKRRFMNVVFAPWATATADPLEYEIQARGPVSVPPSKRRPRSNEQHDWLNPQLWYDGAGEAEDEFP